MKPRKITIIREMTVGDGLGERRSSIEYDEDTGLLIRPDEKLGSEENIQLWDELMESLSVLNADKGSLSAYADEHKQIDVRSIVCGIGVMDWCIND